MRHRLRECEVCGTIRRPSEIGPTLVFDAETRTYTDVVRCRDRSACIPRPTSPEEDGRVVRRGGLLVLK